jgi:hypothetical protein
MIELLSNPYFQFFVIPLLTTMLTVFVKIVSRNDRYNAVVKEDFSIGLELAITAILLLVTDTLKYANYKLSSSDKNIGYNAKLLTVPWILLVFLIGIWGISTIIRKVGWKNANELNWWWGIIFPNLFGLSSLIFVVNWINS